MKMPMMRYLIAAALSLALAVTTPADAQWNQPNYGPLLTGATGLTATGSTQKDAITLPNQVNIFTTVPSGAGTQLPAVTPVSIGAAIEITNNDTNTLNVYPGLGDSIYNGAVNAPITVAGGGGYVRLVMLTPPSASTHIWQTGPPPGVPANAIAIPSSVCNWNGTTGNDVTTVVQAAINNAAAVNGEVDLPSTPCLISSVLKVAANVTIHGQGCFENWGPLAAGTIPNIPVGSPPLKGSGFVQATAATDIMDITGAGITVNLKGFCGQWKTPYANTGDGISVIPPTVSGGQDNGMIGSIWEGVKIYGVDGNHHGFQLTNALLNNFVSIRSYGGGAVLINNNSAGYSYGNATFTDLYGVVFLSGSSNGIDCTGSGAAPISYFTAFVKPQMWVWTPAPAIPGTTPPGAGQLTANFSANCVGYTFTGVDFEGQLANYPVYGSSIQNSYQAANNASLATLFANPSPLTVYQNTYGTAVQIVEAYQLNPTSGAAATLTVFVGPVSATVGAQVATWNVGFISAPANSTQGTEQTFTFIIPAGYYWMLVPVNATRVWTSTVPVGG